MRHRTSHLPEALLAPAVVLPPGIAPPLPIPALLSLRVTLGASLSPPAPPSPLLPLGLTPVLSAPVHPPTLSASAAVTISVLSDVLIALGSSAVTVCRYGSHVSAVPPLSTTAVGKGDMAWKFPCTKVAGSGKIAGRSITSRHSAAVDDFNRPYSLELDECR